MRINFADTGLLAGLLNRNKKNMTRINDIDLNAVLREVLTWANRLVPSESGSLLLDDPDLKWDDRKKEGRLYFAACFGRGSSRIVNTYLGSNSGIAGKTYTSGKPHISRDAPSDTRYNPSVADRIRYKTRSIICAPVVIEGSTIGVIELINRRERAKYTRQELSLLMIFAGYTATLIHNALIARSFEELSKRDTLTGLFNDRYFFQRLEEEVEKATVLESDISMIFFDLDHFKEVNDTHGHLAGSSVLKEIGDIMREIFHGTSAVCSRYGGDEYIVIMPGMAMEEAATYAELLRSSIRKNIFLREKVPWLERPLNIKDVITCSIGVASFKKNVARGKSIRQMADSLVKEADKAMYTAKENGRDRILLARGPRRAVR
ncbi:MAG: GGDEF domain-containing protein [Nitrospirae bacterium]|nr:GGDEF domain-containing protein [Nitrospirota bacterium]